MLGSVEKSMLRMAWIKQGDAHDEVCGKGHAVASGNYFCSGRYVPADTVVKEDLNAARRYALFYTIPEAIRVRVVEQFLLVVYDGD